MLGELRLVSCEGGEGWLSETGWTVVTPGALGCDSYRMHMLT